MPGKSLQLDNQQEIFKKKFMNILNNSSETIRRTTFDFQSFLNTLPAHKKRVSRSFLEWFIGFTEGDGSFLVSHACTGIRLFFIITQKEPQILHFIKTNLGFGRVTSHGIYFRFIVADKKNSDRLIHLFNGNLVFYKTQRRFNAWLEARNSYQDPGPLPPTYLFKKEWESDKIQPVFGNLQNMPFLDTGWFSGLIDAHGCFFIQKQNSIKYSLGFRVRLRFIVDQKGERWFFEQLQLIFESGIIINRKLKKVVLDRNEKSIDANSKSKNSFEEEDSMMRYECTALQSFKLLFNYLEKYPLKTSKNINQIRFRKMAFYMARRKELPWTGKLLERIKNLIAELDEKNTVLAP
jgi:hypothetical protein